MQVEGDYEADGYALVRGVVPREVADAFMASLKADVGEKPVPLSRVNEFPNLLVRPAFEIYGFHYKPMLALLWGLTPVMRALTGRDLLPSYDYFRVYRQGDVCKVHHDRQSCEHSMSLTLAYSDGLPWNLDIGRDDTEPSARVEHDFGEERFAALAMQVGDAVIYRGVRHRHGRIEANPNRWSAHLFLHWVERDGPYSEYAFDRHGIPQPVDFTFA